MVGRWIAKFNISGSCRPSEFRRAWRIIEADGLDMLAPHAAVSNTSANLAEGVVRMNYAWNSQEPCAWWGVPEHWLCIKKLPDAKGGPQHVAFRILFRSLRSGHLKVSPCFGDISVWGHCITFIGPRLSLFKRWFPQAHTCSYHPMFVISKIWLKKCHRNLFNFWHGRCTQSFPLSISEVNQPCEEWFCFNQRECLPLPL